MQKDKKYNKIKENIKYFYKGNKVLSNLSISAMTYIIIYYVSYDLPELWENASILADIMFQLSLALIANFIFFVFQVYFPNHKRHARIQPIIQHKINQICDCINMPFLEITEKYLGNQKNLNELTDDDIQLITEKYRPQDLSTVQVAFVCCNLTYNQYFKYCFSQIDNIVQELIFEYEPYLDDEQRDVLILLKENSFRKLFDSPLMDLFDTTGIQGNATMYTFKKYKQIYEKIREV